MILLYKLRCLIISKHQYLVRIYVHLYSKVCVTVTHIGIEGLDFIFAPQNVSFPAGVIRVRFNVTIVEDNILEANESFTLGVDPLTLPDRVTTGSSNYTTVTILNDDCK